MTDGVKAFDTNSNQGPTGDTDRYSCREHKDACSKRKKKREKSILNQFKCKKMIIDCILTQSIRVIELDFPLLHLFHPSTSLFRIHF